MTGQIEAQIECRGKSVVRYFVQLKMAGFD